jgi:hypothetical protein
VKSTATLIKRVLAGVTLAFTAVAISAPARANDAGPQADVQTIRVTLPSQLAAALKKARVEAPLVADDVVVAAQGAVVAWHAGAMRGMTILKLTDGAWQPVANANTIASENGNWAPLYKPATTILTCMDGAWPNGPTSYDIGLETSPALGSLASANIESVATADRVREARLKTNVVSTKGVVWADCYTPK